MSAKAMGNSVVDAGVGELLQGIYAETRERSTTLISTQNTGDEQKVKNTLFLLSCTIKLFMV